MDRFRVLFLLQLVAGFLVPREIFGQEVSSVSALQKGNSIEISYELKSEAPCDVQAFVSLNNGRKWIGPLSNVKGDIGDFILAGKKQFEWDVLKSQDDLVGSEIKFKVVATKVDPYKPKMVFVKGGKFQMGSVNGEPSEMPIHEVEVGSFEIGKYEVTQFEWREIMGSNPSHFSNCDNCPVESITWYEAQQFVYKLNLFSVKKYRLPTEAEWEYAASSCVNTCQEIYPGGDDINGLSWNVSNSDLKTHPVGRKLPNQLGVFDLGGNVFEWCEDWSSPYENSSFILAKEKYRILRGGSWGHDYRCRIKNRDGDEPQARNNHYGLRLVSSKQNYTSNFDLEMVSVEGGTFQMGSNSGEEDEKPVHAVTLSSFKMAKYEVTQAQWKAVMGNNPSQFSNCDQCPVENVSFNDVQEYIKRFNSITGKLYRLPTEAEWEYAARGGKKSKGYQYSGSNDINLIAWVDLNSNGKTQIVGLKKPNELGIFDMSGNVWEWTLDRYSSYNFSNMANTEDNKSGYVIRGGSFRNHPTNCSVSDRFGFNGTDSNGGFRLVITVD